MAVAVGLLLTAVPGQDPGVLLALCFCWGGIAGALYTCALADAGQRLPTATLVLAVLVMMVGYIVGCWLGPLIGGAGLGLHSRSGLFIALAVPVLCVGGYACSVGRKAAVRSTGTRNATRARSEASPG